MMEQIPYLLLYNNDGSYRKIGEKYVAENQRTKEQHLLEPEVVLPILQSENMELSEKTPEDGAIENENNTEDSNVKEDLKDPELRKKWSVDQEKPIKRMLYFYIKVFKSKDPMIIKKAVHTKWTLVSDKLKDEGFTFTAIQCRNKFTGLERYYKKVREENNKSGNDNKKMKVCSSVKTTLDELWGKKPSTTLTKVVQSEDLADPNLIEELLQRERSENEREEESPMAAYYSRAAEELVDSPDSPPRENTSSGNGSSSTTNSTPEIRSTIPSVIQALGKRKRREKKSIVQQMEVMEEQRKTHHLAKLNEMKLRREKIGEFVQETKRTNDLFEAHNTLMQRILDKM